MMDNGLLACVRRDAMHAQRLAAHDRSANYIYEMSIRRSGFALKPGVRSAARGSGGCFSEAKVSRWAMAPDTVPCPLLDETILPPFPRAALADGCGSRERHPGSAL